MSGILATLERYSDILFAVAFAWVLGGMAVAAARRRAKGLPLGDDYPKDAIFLEKWTSGRSLRSFLSRWGGGRNCIYVAVTRERLIIRPHFPFILFLRDNSGLEISVPRGMIERIALPMGEKVLLAFRPESGIANIELRLREPVKFRDSLQS